uniref:DAGKc domain-containing protein n=1 Tax=Strongyloides stercoralis TaxID=6248 RepID=A0A0K0EIH1_STRER
MTLKFRLKSFLRNDIFSKNVVGEISNDKIIFTWSENDIEINETYNVQDFIGAKEDIKNADVVDAYFYLINEKTSCRERLFIKMQAESLDQKIELIKMFKSLIKIKQSPHMPKNTLVVSKNKYTVFVIINPFGGTQMARNQWETEVKTIFDEADIIYTVYETKCKLDATRVVNKLKIDKFDCIVVMGGDGMLSEVLNGILTRPDKERALKMPICHIPSGTCNAVASSICFQANEPFPPRDVFVKQAALMCVNPSYIPLRLSVVETKENGNIPMFLSATWGIIADIDIGSERFRWAGMLRLHIESYLRIFQLPSVANYEAIISYIPVEGYDRKKFKIRHVPSERHLLGDDHFDYEEVKEWKFIESNNEEKNKECLDDFFKKDNKLNIPSIDETIPIDNKWVTYSEKVTTVSVIKLSHLGSDIPFLPCAKIDEDILYLCICKWEGMKNRFEMGFFLDDICRSNHLKYPFFDIIPVKAARVEPIFRGNLGHFAVDGEPLKPGQIFQVRTLSKTATLVTKKKV